MTAFIMLYPLKKVTVEKAVWGGKIQSWNAPGNSVQGLDSPTDGLWASRCGSMVTIALSFVSKTMVRLKSKIN